MNHYSMEHYAKDTHQKLRQEARSHRFARKAGSNQNGPGRPISAGRVAAAIIAFAMATASFVVLIYQ